MGWKVLEVVVLDSKTPPSGITQIDGCLIIKIIPTQILLIVYDKFLCVANGQADLVITT